MSKDVAKVAQAAARVKNLLFLFLFLFPECEKKINVRPFTGEAPRLKHPPQCIGYPLCPDVAQLDSFPHPTGGSLVLNFVYYFPDAPGWPGNENTILRASSMFSFLYS